MHARLILAATLLLPPLAVAAAGGTFSRSLAPEEFAAAGLGKLTEAELARLDALVGQHARGTPSAPTALRPAAPSPERERETRPAAAAESRERRVVLAPGTRVEYSAVESRIAGEFRGWEPRKVFTLENGDRWQVIGDDTYVTSPTSRPAVKIERGFAGAYWMRIDGVKPRVKVSPIEAR